MHSDHCATKPSNRLLTHVLYAALVGCGIDASALSETDLAQVIEAIDAQEARTALGRAIASSLCELPPLERTSQLLELATSPRVGLRVAAALALAENLSVIGVEWCIESLARDADAKVREAVADAARSRGRVSDDHFEQVLTRLTRDPTPAVRAAARRARS